MEPNPWSIPIRFLESVSVGICAHEVADFDPIALPSLLDVSEMRGGSVDDFLFAHVEDPFALNAQNRHELIYCPKSL